MTVFTVVCTACGTAFPVDPAKVPPEGVRARCSICGGIFPVETPSAAVSPGEAPALVEDAPEPLGPTVDRYGAAAFPEGGPEPEFRPEPWSGVGEEHVEETASREDEAEASAAGTTEVVTGEVELESAPESPTDALFLADQVAGAASPGPLEDHPTVADAVPGEGPAVGGVAPGSFRLGRRDPHEKARRLARVLVSDIITYNPERHARALQRGTLQEDFEEEIRKSWAEYVEQVGAEMARETSYWTEALNQLLADGEGVF